MAVICPECKQSNPDTSMKCRNCRFPLDTITSEVRQINIDENLANDHTNLPFDAKMNVGEKSGDDVVDTRDMKTPDELIDDDSDNLGESRMKGGIVLLEPKSRKSFHIKAADLDEVVIGRTNSQIGYIPTVDLAQLEGHKYGVSRRHATLSREKHLLKIVDHYSVNGTYLNGQKLVPEQARIVRDKDTIRFGGMAMKIFYVNN